jgi:hypothetical protein
VLGTAELAVGSHECVTALAELSGKQFVAFFKFLVFLAVLVDEAVDEIKFFLEFVHSKSA